MNQAESFPLGYTKTMRMQGGVRGSMKPIDWQLSVATADGHQDLIISFSLRDVHLRKRLY